MDIRTLQSIGSGFQGAAVVLAANHLGITAAATAVPATAEELAARLGLDPRAVATVCEALGALGVLEREAGGWRVTAALRDALDPTAPESMVQILRHQWHLMGRWAELDHVVASGRPIPRPPEDDVQREAFILAMADLARLGNGALWDAVDLRGRHHLVDVGGGPGELAIGALERYPDLTATVFDRPAVLDIARAYAKRRGCDRLQYASGDAVSDPVPACDIALVSSLVHAYGDHDTRRIAENVATGVAPGGLVVIREFMWDDETHSGPVSTALFAVNMLIGTPAGKCYTAAELEAIFGQAGFGAWRRAAMDPRSTVLIGVRE